MAGKPDYESMSDEDFLNASEIDEPTSEPVQETETPAPAEPAAETTPAAATDAPASVAAEEPGSGEGDDLDDDPDFDPMEGEDDDLDAAGEKPAADHTTPNHTTPEANPKPETPAQPEAAAEGQPAAEGTPGDPAQAPEETFSFETAYKQIMAPFKANGRDFTPQSPEEVIRLMQMGANYTRKMQALAPNLKMMRMLENNGLLDENKLAFLIDLDRKDPGAIQKLLHDGQIDPLNIDPSATPSYQPGNHSVSDQEMAFVNVLGDVRSTPTGMETIQEISTNWDQASRDEIYNDPSILEVINVQRQNGIYNAIKTEMDRQSMLGALPVGTPFLKAYKAVGDQLNARGVFAALLNPQPAADPAPVANTAPAPAPAPAAPLVQQQAPAAQPPQVVATRTGSARRQATNDAQARAAMPSRSNPSPQTSTQDFNPLAMSDEDFMRATGG